MVLLTRLRLVQALADGLKGHKGLRILSLANNGFADEASEAGSAQQPWSRSRFGVGFGNP